MNSLICNYKIEGKKTRECLNSFFQIVWIDRVNKNLHRSFKHLLLFELEKIMQHHYHRSLSFQMDLLSPFIWTLYYEFCECVFLVLMYAVCYKNVINLSIKKKNKLIKYMLDKMTQ